ncbi:phenylpyruvate tautomerase MIF-related protein [Oceanirhabdus sp. W0125-5]|uniref:phenylpyruvate tautomerase MIF-related protein n=1 Tax=Oceanirhabdus sp. W0125-5 TaxID=2999116 RepID=UPI0022F2C2D9|nr:phenylpyruvate tautomerase MIF-related protein [Oceanirhabdus sp. W0125-5]WBW94754.1 phenylpyruvate tautomerase MIF-related protein [Oceanirhabdus sp. W0125-5]
MPFINSKLSISLTKEKETHIKQELGKLISLIPGKTEQWLMVGFEDNYNIFFGGEKNHNIAFVEVKLYGSAPKNNKDRMVEAICNLYETELSIPKANIFVTFQEISDWGWNGRLL